MYWANFLHIYQPPTQTEQIVRKVTREGYRVLVRVLRASPNAKITLNISAVLTQQLARYGLDDVITGLRQLAERGQIEFVGSAIYHPILPLIPRDEVIRQIELNTKVNRSYFGDVYNPKGFFPPEMCYSLEIARIVRELGFQWIIVDEIAYNGKIGSAQNDLIYTVNGVDNLVVFFKERPFSAGITYGKYPSGEPFTQVLADRLDADCYLLTGTDGEVYGHHRPGQEKLLEDIWSQGRPPTCTISELIKLFPKRKESRPLPSSWSTWEDEMVQGIPYPQWDYPEHELHRLQWQLTHLALEMVKSVPRNTVGYPEARQLLDEGLHSCQYWWASCRPWWDTGMVEWGAKKLFDAISSVKSAFPHNKLEKATKVFESVIAIARRWQDTGEARKRKEEYLKQHSEVSTELTFGGDSSL
jgi:4-alpha-glucanotransferase